MNSVAKDARASGAKVGLEAETIIIRGGRPLTGRIDVKGAKNLVTKAMVAAILGDTPSTLRDVPVILLSARAGYLTGAMINCDGGTQF